MSPALILNHLPLGISTPGGSSTSWVTGNQVRQAELRMTSGRLAIGVLMLGPQWFGLYLPSIGSGQNDPRDVGLHRC